MHAHAPRAMLGRDVDLDIGTGWLVGLSSLTVLLVAIGVLLAVTDDGGTGARPIGAADVAAQPATISEELAAAQERLPALREIEASPALLAPATTELLLATRAFAAQQRDTALEIEQRLGDALPPAESIVTVPVLATGR